MASKVCNVNSDSYIIANHLDIPVVNSVWLSSIITLRLACLWDPNNTLVKMNLNLLIKASRQGSRTEPHQTNPSQTKPLSDKTPLTNTHFGHNPTLKLTFNKCCFISPLMLLIDWLIIFIIIYNIYIALSIILYNMFKSVLHVK